MPGDKVNEWTNEWTKIKFNVSAHSALENPVHVQVVNGDGEIKIIYEIAHENIKQRWWCIGARTSYLRNVCVCVVRTMCTKKMQVKGSQSRRKRRTNIGKNTLKANSM